MFVVIVVVVAAYMHVTDQTPPYTWTHTACVFILLSTLPLSSTTLASIMAPQDKNDEDLFDKYLYLGDDFEPSKLKVAQLRKVLLTHNVKFTQSMKKQQLEDLFNSEVYANRADLRRKYWNATASSANFEPATPPTKPSKSRASSEEPSSKPSTKSGRVSSRGKGEAKSESKAAEKPSTKAKEEVKEDAEPLIVKPQRRGRQTKTRSTASKGRSSSVANSEAESEAESEKEPDPSLQLSPRAMRAQKRRVASDTLQQAGEVPNLQPPKQEVTHEDTEKPTDKRTASAHAPPSPVPASPRRKRANRKVDIPSLENPDDFVPPAAEDIKLKAPRASKRKAEESNDEEESFVNDNVFQRNTPSKKVKRDHHHQHHPHAGSSSSKTKHEPATFLPQESPLDIGSTLPSVSDPAPVPEFSEHIQEYAAPGNSDLNIDLILNEDVIETLDREFAESSRHLPEDYFRADNDFVRDDVADYLTSAATGDAEAPRVDASYAEVSNLPGNETAERIVIHEEEPNTTATAPSNETDNNATQSTPVQSAAAPRSSNHGRRGFLPSFESMGASRDFVDQLGNQKPASSASEPAPVAESSEGAIPVSRQSPDMSYLPDTESAAAQEIHDILGSLPEMPKVPQISTPKIPKFRLRRPGFLRLPRVRFPRIRFPRIRFPRVSFPRVRFPRIPRPSLSRVRQKLPNRPALPRPKLPSCSTLFKPVFLLAKLVRFILVWSFLLGIFFQLASTVAWYRSEYSLAEFCGTGKVHFPTYPIWAEYNTGNEYVELAQSHVRDALDHVRPTCIPCPPHAQCYQGRIALCDSEYQPSESYLAEFGIWPLPPSCQPDWELKRKKDVLSEGAVDFLRQRRAEVLCDEGIDKGGLSDTELAALSSDQLHDLLYSRKSHLLPDGEFEELWEQVVELLPSKFSDVYVVSVRNSDLNGQELTSQTHGDNSGRGASEEVSSDGNSQQEQKQELAHENQSVIYFVSHSDAFIPWDCKLRRTVLAWYERHRQAIQLSLGAVLVVFVAGLKVQQRLALKRRDLNEADKLIGLIKYQREAAESDATGYTPAYVKVTDMRKEVLSGSKRRSQQETATWERVQKLVESNPDVRCRQIELRGEIHRVWEWSA